MYDSATVSLLLSDCYCQSATVRLLLSVPLSVESKKLAAEYFDLFVSVLTI